MTHFHNRDDETYWHAHDLPAGLTRHPVAAGDAHPRGRFVDEIYTEDEEEAERLADEEAMRSARMLGCVAIGAIVVLAIVAGWILVLVFGSSPAR